MLNVLFHPVTRVVALVGGVLLLVAVITTPALYAVYSSAVQAVLTWVFELVARAFGLGLDLSGA